ncbi:MAG: ribonuclease P protein component [Fimbriimonadaceae bacterium]
MRGPSKTRFEEIFKEGKRAAGRFCRLTALPGTGLIGIATSKKIGNAPQRNKAKRRFREVFRTLAEKLDPSMDYIAVAFPESADVKLDEIRSELARQLGDVNSRWASELESS